MIRRFRLRLWNRQGDYDAPIFNDVTRRVKVPEERCLALDDYRRDGSWTFSIDWLPPSLLPPTDTDEWCANVVGFLKKRGIEQRRLARRAPRLRRAA